MTRPIALGLLALMVWPICGQNETEDIRYFSLSTSRTFAPGEKATVDVWTQGIGALEFRLYKVKDPVRFFGQLRDAHGFGGYTNRRRKGGRETWLESFQNWKLDLRASIRDAFRGQFGAEERAGIRQLMVGKPSRKSPPQKVDFAQVPVLNSDQLITRFRQEISKKNPWENVNVAFDLKDPGVYVVEATNGDLRAYTVLMASRNVVITKSTAGRMVGFVVDRATGKPIANCPTLAWAGGAEVSRKTTDRDGLVDLAIDGRGESDEFFLMAMPAGDFAVNSVPGYSLSSAGAPPLTAMVYTDRPVYRPSHPVNYRAIVRQQTLKGYVLPEDRKARIEVTGADGQVVFREFKSLSDFGTLNGQFTLPPKAALGSYSLEIRLGDRSISGSFDVEEYKKPEYSVKVTPGEKRYLQGEPITARIEARYYFGEPVTKAVAKYAVYRSRYWAPWQDPEDADPAGEEPSGWGEEQVGEEVEVKLDSDGVANIRVENPVSKDGENWVYRVEARVRDAGAREITGSGSVVAPYTSYVVSAWPRSYVYNPGSPVKLTVSIRDWDNQPVAAAYRVEVFRYKSDVPYTSVTGNTGPGGEGESEFVIQESGSFRARVRARTPEGREAVSTAYLWISGSATADPSTGEIQLVTDKKSYKPGDTARVLILTKNPGAHLLVTTEAQGIHSAQVVAAAGNSVTVDIPVKPEYAPNVYVSATYLHGGELYQGTRLLSVPAEDRKLNVTLAAAKPEFKPGEPASYTIEAKDYMGKPVAAEFSIGVVDEAIYAIRPDLTRDPLRVFYGRVYSQVSTESSLSFYFNGQAGRRPMMLASARASLGQLKPNAPVQPKVRKAFPDTAFWNAAVTTDSSGKAQVSFAFPDSLTTWRATARGVSPDAKVGAALNRVIVRKNLILRPVTPRFLTEGDEVTLSMAVNNYLTTEKRARVSLEGAGFDLVDGGARDVSIPSRGEAKVDFKVRVKPGREARILGKGLTDEESDAVELILPVKPVGVPLTISKAGRDAAEFQLDLPAKSIPTSRDLELSLSPSVAGALFGGLDYLAEFPYGCTEQTMSSFLPAVIVSQTFKKLGVKSDRDPAVLAAKVDAGLDRLADHQHADGGWGWWREDESMDFMTAYVVDGLSRYLTVNPDNGRARSMQAKGVTWLKQNIQALDGEIRAYAAYALAMADPANRSYLEVSWADRRKLNVQAVAQLGLAYLTLGDAARAKDATEMLLQKVKRTETQALWGQDSDRFMDFAFDTSPEATAAAVKLIAKLDPKSEILPLAAQWLVANRNEGYYWHSTKQTALVIDALSGYVEVSKELAPNFSVEVEVNGKQVMTKQFTASDLQTALAPSVKVPAELKNRIKIRKSGDGRLYWMARASYASGEEKLVKTGSVALNLLRDYYRLIPEKRGERIVHRLEPLSGPVNQGDTIACRLTLTGGDWRYLLIEDPIPSGVEFVTREDSYELDPKPDWWTQYSARREYRDDRAALFQTWFNRGQTQYFYLFKVVNPGKFQIPPARVTPMYQPGYVSTTERRSLEVQQ